MNGEPMKYRCLVVDDEYMARLLLENYIQKLPELELVALCENALVAGPLIREHKIDLLFLDIQMPLLSGLEMITTLPYKPAIIFTTAFSEHAIDGYRLDAIDYLLKPFSFERFVQAVHKAIQFISPSRHQGTSQGYSKDEVAPDHFFVKSNGKLIKIREYLVWNRTNHYPSVAAQPGRIAALSRFCKSTQILYCLHR
jgi:DNA-binding LytR/AlgR family response regulator